MIGIIILTVVALILGIILVTISSKLETNSNVDEIKSYFPGINCGGCGLNCEDLAKLIAEDPINYTRCKVLRGEKLENFKKYLKEKYNID